MDNISNTPQTRTNALDFFLHLGSIVTLYTVAGNFVNLLFRIINVAFPETLDINYWYTQSGSEISFPVATLIIVFPIFVFLCRFIYKSYDLDQNKKHLGVRKWLIYITLFIAGVMLAGDLVMVLYKFLDGQDLTVAFLLKALVVLLVSGSVFGYYLSDIRDLVSKRGRKMWFIATSLILVASIVLGFSVIGSPKTQRLIKLDNQKIADLQNIEWQIINYWQTNGKIPDTAPKIMGINEYEYRKTSNDSYELCATFNLETRGTYNLKSPIPEYNSSSINWDHKAGYQCFKRTIDPITYPTRYGI